jgi:hypothetical protein
MNYLKSYFDLCFLGFECEVHKTLTFLYTFSALGFLAHCLSSLFKNGFTQLAITD